MKEIAGTILYLKEGEGNAHRQGVDAGGNGEDEHFLELDAVAALFAFAEGFPDHVDADEHQQQESDPGGKGGDEALKLLT